LLECVTALLLDVRAATQERPYWFRFQNALSRRRQGFEFPWGHVSPLAIIWAIERDCFEYWKRSLSVTVAKH
jgi:hypothetical protein